MSHIRLLFNDDFSLRLARDSLTLQTRLRCIWFGCSGWQLGEHALWAKMSVFESATHVPLIIRAPFRPNSVGAVTPVLSEMIDLYLTLADRKPLTFSRAQVCECATPKRQSQFCAAGSRGPARSSK